LIFTVQMFFEWTFRRNIRVLEFKLYCNKTNEAPELDLEYSEFFQFINCQMVDASDKIC
jgi:hypothetical protein